MESTVLANLETIKILLWILVFLSLISTCILVFGVIGKNLQSKEMIKSTFFKSEAQKLEDQGDYSGLIDHARDRLESYPKDMSANYYLGIGYLRQKKYAGALHAFSQIQSIDPHWETQLIQDYVEQVRGAMDGPKRHET